MARRSAVGKLAAAKTKERFSEELSSYTNLTAEETKKLFPTMADRDELLELIKIVNSNASNNAKKAELINKIRKIAGAVIKIGKKFATGL